MASATRLTSTTPQPRGGAGQRVSDNRDDQDLGWRRATCSKFEATVLLTVEETMDAMQRARLPVPHAGDVTAVGRDPQKGMFVVPELPLRMIIGRITSCSGSSALLVGPASACRPTGGYLRSLIVTWKGWASAVCHLWKVDGLDLVAGQQLRRAAVVVWVGVPAVALGLARRGDHADQGGLARATRSRATPGSTPATGTRSRCARTPR